MADIKLNAEDWERLTEDEQAQVINALKQAGILTGEDTIIPDPQTPSRLTEEQRQEMKMGSIETLRDVRHSHRLSH